ncbi:MAG: CPBP family glutamic-type intramembrane protease, partial [Caldilineaceae bacterium]
AFLLDGDHTAPQQERMFLIGAGALLVSMAGASQEFGWRGYMLDELQTRASPLLASLLLGLLVWVWLLPAMVIPGAPLWALRAGPLGLWGSLTSDLCTAVLLTWLYNRGRRSLLAPLAARMTMILTLFAFGPLAGRAALNWSALMLGVALSIALLSPGFGRRQEVRVRVVAPAHPSPLANEDGESAGAA